MYQIREPRRADLDVYLVKLGKYDAKSGLHFHTGTMEIDPLDCGEVLAVKQDERLHWFSQSTRRG